MLKKVLTWVSVGLLVLAGSLALLFSWSPTGWKALAVPTTSMHPAIPQNSLVLVHRVPIKTLKVGDVITYVNPFNPKATISHRIVKTYLISGKVPGFVTKGDANKVADVPISEGSVVGKVVWHVPHAGGWLLWSKKPVALLPLIYIPALLLMFEEVQRLNEYFKLGVPYRLPGFRRLEVKHHHRLAAASVMTLVLVLVGAAFWQPVSALLKSNTVVLANNHLVVAATAPKCSGNTSNSNNVVVTNSSSQSASSGSASSSGNTSGSSATSGNVSNNSSSSTTVTIKNGC